MRACSSEMRASSPWVCSSASKYASATWSTCAWASATARSASATGSACCANAGMAATANNSVSRPQATTRAARRVSCMSRPQRTVPPAFQVIAYPAARPPRTAPHPKPDVGDAQGYRSRPRTSWIRHASGRQHPSVRRSVPSVTTDLKLGLQLGYWTAQPPAGRPLVELAQQVEALGFDSIWTGESWSSDAFSPLVWVGAHTSRINLATGIAQVSARSPVTAAMHAMTIDALTEGRFRLGIGVSGPQVVEGGDGRPFGQPLARTREYIDILRQVWRREEPVTNDGPHYPLPYDGPGAVGLGKPLKVITHPPRNDIPVYLGAEGPKNVRLATEIADGWIPLYYSPTRPEVYADQLADAPEGFEIAVNVTVTVADDVSQALLPVKGALGFYIGGMGAKGRNFHTDLMARMGFEEEAHHIQDLFFAGKREDAVLAGAGEVADDISLLGPAARIRERIEAWRKTPVTTLLIGSRDPEVLQLLAQLTR